MNEDHALIFRPKPSDLVDGSEPVQLGGLPQLPSELKWPLFPDGTTPYTFVAQINLDRLPAPVNNDVRRPVMPNHGSLFLFLPMESDGIYGMPAVVLYTSEDVGDLPTCAQPRPDFSLTNDTDALHQNAILDDGQTLYEQWAEAFPLASPRFDRDASRQEIQKRFETYRKECTRCLRGGPFPVATTPQGQAILEIDHLPTNLTKFAKLRVENLTWELVFLWAKEFQRLIFEEGLKLVRLARTQGLEDARMAKLEDGFNSHQVTLEKVDISDPKPTVWRMMSRPKTFDRRAAQLMGLAQEEFGQLPEPAYDRFCRLLHDIQKNSNSTNGKGAALLHLLGAFKYQEFITAGDVAECSTAAFRHARKIVQGAQKMAKGIKNREAIFDSEIRSAFNAYGQYPPVPSFQMFGCAQDWQSAALDKTDNELLFEFTGGPGLSIQFQEELVQIWISPDDLAEGRFENVVTTIQAS